MDTHSWHRSFKRERQPRWLSKEGAKLFANWIVAAGISLQSNIGESLFASHVIGGFGHASHRANFIVRARASSRTAAIVDARTTGATTRSAARRPAGNVKSLDATYRSGQRGAGWFKLKPQTTIDAVIMGYQEGRNGFSGLVGAIMLAWRVGMQRLATWEAS